MDFALHMAQASLVISVTVIIASLFLYNRAMNLIKSLFARVDELEIQLVIRDGRIMELEQAVEKWKKKFNDLWQKYIELQQENDELKNKKKLL